MRLRADQLESRLAAGVAPVYLVSGDEPLLVGEAGDAIRQAARAQGYSERTVYHADASFDWGELARAAGSLSLFAERRVIDLRLPSGRPGDAGARALTEYAGAAPADTLLLITTPRLDAQLQKSKWFKAIDAAGVVIQIWPPEGAEYTGWVARRMRALGLQPEPDAVALLAERVEGNLLACVQEIEKIRLLGGPGPLDADRVIQSVTDSARYDVFTLVDCALDGDIARCVRVARGLEGEGVEPTLVLWALARAIRAHARFAVAIARGEHLEQLVQWDKAWSRRQALIRRALQRHGVRSWWRMLRRAAAIDRMIKGRAAGNVRDELLQLALMIAGLPAGRRPRQAG
jgi:DNA polymerase III subunit delta